MTGTDDEMSGDEPAAGPLITQQDPIHCQRSAAISPRRAAEPEDGEEKPPRGAA